MINQMLADTYLRCPACHCETSLKCADDKVACGSCGFEAPSRFGIPALITKEELGTQSNDFLGLPIGENNIVSPHKKWKVNFFQRHLCQEAIHFFNSLFFAFKFGLKQLMRKDCCEEVDRAIRYGWRNYYNIILKANEVFHFKRMKNYIVEPSLEIGCGGCKTTNMIFEGSIDSITFGCEYFMNTFLNDKGKLNDQMYKVIKNYVGGSIKSLPFKTSAFNSVVMVHIIDHIVHTNEFFKEINRILKPGGYLIMSGYSAYTFEHLPGVVLRKKFSKAWAHRYMQRRIQKDNPRGAPLASNFEYDSIGQNMHSLAQWQNIAKNYGFELTSHAFFGRYFSYFMDIEYRGYYNSHIFNNLLYRVISKIIVDEKTNPPSEEDSTNIILVLKKK